ncbi:hypothetical protein L226DRAFT_529676 [Lentinus tigrinus ALCF2SS1-7]|uniref:HIG1 domain-containing protein n=1 Tax=Lentinus tigrinus ALCF2SS1-6 TaxID=1328759 RepID=A0A5C2SWE9_9APHY|nr:hypothetical protein L227DRAFT_569476 [Lentinus tigrinus ALCF2SS1-6]RPD81268.1 hypothetical protein L226DRAFT_529676 [Lentinus tigrinus ALCF2SS1-7]
MKIVTKEELDAQQHATIVGGLKGLAGGLGFALPASYIAYRRFPYYRALQPSLKAFGVILVAVPAFVICAERAGQMFEREQWKDAGAAELETIEAREQRRWQNLSVGQKVSDFVSRHQYGVIVGSWATAMAGTFGYIMRDPYQTVPQKIVQARVWAQGLTIGIIIAAGILTSSQRAKNRGDEDDPRFRHLPIDHSWKDILEQEQKEQARINASLGRDRAT